MLKGENQTHVGRQYFEYYWHFFLFFVVSISLIQSKASITLWKKRIILTGL